MEKKLQDNEIDKAAWKFYFKGSDRIIAENSRPDMVIGFVEGVDWKEKQHKEQTKSYEAVIPLHIYGKPLKEGDRIDLCGHGYVTIKSVINDCNSCFNGVVDGNCFETTFWINNINGILKKVTFLMSILL